MPQIEQWMREAVKQLRRAINGDRSCYEINHDLAAEIIASEYEKAEGSMLANSIGELRAAHASATPAMDHPQVWFEKGRQRGLEQAGEYVGARYQDDRARFSILDLGKVFGPSVSGEGIGSQVAEAAPAETDEHHSVDDGYCSCGVLCETGTGLRRHLARVAGQGRKP